MLDPISLNLLPHYYNIYHGRLNKTIIINVFHVLDTLISQTPISVAGTVNGLMFPDDVIQKKSSIRQELNGKQVVGDLQVTGRLDVSQTINQVNLQRMSDLFEASSTQFGLHVLGRFNLQNINFWILFLLEL